jgi:AcrR family transcriptional regulator
MDDQQTTQGGWRGSWQVWVDAAYDVLIDQGVDAVKIQPLAGRLHLSRTSFYWFFKDRDALLAALIDLWAGRTTDPMVAAAQAYAETPTEALLNVTGCFLDAQVFDARLEFAVRGWALQDAGVLARLQVADDARLTALRDMLLRWGHGADDADVRARAIYLVQIGYIAMQTLETLETRLMRVPTYMEIFTGQRPTAAEMARFRARLQPVDQASGVQSPKPNPL